MPCASLKVKEVAAGVFEGTPESEAANGYGRYPLAWALQAREIFPVDVNRAPREMLLRDRRRLASLLADAADAQARERVIGEVLTLYDTEEGLLAHQLHTQIAMHSEYGGVVPELDACFAALNLGRFITGDADVAGVAS